MRNFNQFDQDDDEGAADDYISFFICLLAMLAGLGLACLIVNYDLLGFSYLFGGTK